MKMILFGLSVIKGILNDTEKFIEDNSSTLESALIIQKAACEAILKVCEVVAKEK